MKLYYVWSSALGPMADIGEPTLEAAIDKFWTTYRRQHLKRSKPNGADQPRPTNAKPL